MEREKPTKIKKIGKVVAFGGAAVTLAVLAKLGKSGEVSKIDDFEARFDKPLAQVSGEEQIEAAREIDEQIIFQNESRKASKWEAIGRLPTPTPMPMPVINNGVYEVEASQADSEPEAVGKAQPENPAVFENPAILEKYRAELPGILELARTHPAEFTLSNQGSVDFEAIEMYYPIYRAAQERFGVPWALLYVMHGQESTFSADESCFAEGVIHYGAMQRSIAYHPQEDVDRYFSGMEYLLTLPVRHFDDAKEIVYASAVMREYTDQEGSIQEALFRYSAAGPARYRWAKYLEISALFDIPAQ